MMGLPPRAASNPKDFSARRPSAVDSSLVTMNAWGEELKGLALLLLRQQRRRMNSESPTTTRARRQIGPRVCSSQNEVHEHYVRRSLGTSSDSRFDAHLRIVRIS